MDIRPDNGGNLISNSGHLLADKVKQRGKIGVARKKPLAPSSKQVNHIQVTRLKSHPTRSTVTFSRLNRAVQETVQRARDWPNVDNRRVRACGLSGDKEAEIRQQFVEN